MTNDTEITVVLVRAEFQCSRDQLMQRSFPLRELGPEQLPLAQQAKLFDLDHCLPYVDTVDAQTKHKPLALMTRKFKSNTSRGYCTALKSLQQECDLVIRQVDKGSSTTVLDRILYIREGRQHLEDQSTNK